MDVGWSSCRLDGDTGRVQIGTGYDTPDRQHHDACKWRDAYRNNYRVRDGIGQCGSDWCAVPTGRGESGGRSDRAAAFGIVEYGDRNEWCTHADGDRAGCRRKPDDFKCGDGDGRYDTARGVTDQSRQQRVDLGDDHSFG